MPLSSALTTECTEQRQGRIDKDVTGTIYGMKHKTTVYLPDELKRALAREARRRGISEAQVIREAIANAVARPRPNAGILNAEPFAERTDELLAGFGDR